MRQCKGRRSCECGYLGIHSSCRGEIRYRATGQAAAMTLSGQTRQATLCRRQEGTRMRHTLIGKNLEVTIELREFFDAKVAKLDRLTPTFSDHLVSLQATVEKNLKRGDFSTSVSLHFPQQTLHAE